MVGRFERRHGLTSVLRMLGQLPVHRLSEKPPFIETILKRSIMSTSTKAQLAILDDYFDIASSKFAQLRSRLDVTSFPKTLNARQDDDRKKLIDRLQRFEIISTMRERTAFPVEVLKALPNLKLLMTTGLKNASIDMKACKELGITVVGATGAGRSTASSKPKGNSLDSTTEQTWALILGLARNTVRDAVAIQQGGWETSPATGLKGKTIGLLGLGKLGTMTAKIAKFGFGMHVLAWSASLTQAKADEQAESCGLPKGAFHLASSKEELIKAADILSIHYVLSDRSRGMVGAKELAAMKKDALLINTSRGPLIDEDALLQCLREGRIGGVGLDVFDLEPLPSDSAWRTTKWGEGGASKVLLSPHMGYVEEDVMIRWYEETAENVERYLDGQEVINKIA